MADINPNSLRSKIISLCSIHRGPGIAALTHYLDLEGFEFKESVLQATLYKLIKLGLLYIDRVPCCTCQRAVTHYFVTDAARINYPLELSCKPISPPTFQYNSLTPVLP